MDSNASNFINLPSYNSSKSFWTYTDLILKKTANIESNLNIQKSLNIKSFKIDNNCIFIGNVNIKNYNIKIKNNVLISGNLNIKKNKLQLLGNINCNDYILNFNKFESDLNINKNINVKNNFHGDNLHVSKNCIFQNKLKINNNLNVYNNLIAYGINVNSINTIINQDYLIKLNLNLQNLHILKNLNLKGNIECNYLNILKKSKCNNLIINDGIIELGENLNSIGSIGFNKTNQNFLININNLNYIFSDFYEKNNKSLVKIDSDNISFTINNNNILNFSNNLDCSYNTNIKNIEVLNNASVNNNCIINNNLHNNICNIDSGYIKLPIITDKYSKGAIGYNINTNKINVTDINGWTDIKILDSFNTGIDIIDKTTIFQVKDNNIITLNNNYINFNSNVTFYNNVNADNLHISTNLNIKKNSYIDNKKLQSYRNIIRVYDDNRKKYEVITQQKFESDFKISYKSNNFFINGLTTNFKYLNTHNYLNNKNIIVNNTNYFIYQIIYEDIFISQILLQFINYVSNNVLTLQILKNNLVINEFNITSNKILINLDNELYFKKNDLISVKIKSNENNINQSLLINFLGYYYCNSKFKGSTNFINDCPITFNNNNFNINVNTNFYKNINCEELIIQNNQLIVSKLSLNNNYKDNTLFNIKDILNIYDDSRISIGSNKILSNSLLSIDNTNLNSKNSLFVNGNIEFDSNLNILDNLIVNNINIDKIDTNSINITNNINNVKYDYNNINCNNLSIKSSINLIDDLNNNDFINSNNLVLPKYNKSYSNLLTNNSVYLSLSNNNNMLFIYNINEINKRYINHKNINYNNYNYDFNQVLSIKNNSINILSNNINNNILNIDKTFEIKNNGNFVINKDLIIKNINYSKKMKSLLYDIYGPKNVNYKYDLSNYKITINNNQNLYKTVFFDSSYITTLNKNNLYYDTILKKPYYLLKGFTIEIDILYIKDIVLLNNQLNTFINNIDYNSIILNNPYNFNISYVISNNGKILYPTFTDIFNNTNYGLKVEIK